MVNFSKFFGCLNLGVLAFSGWRPGPALSILQCLGQLPTPSNCLSPNVSTTKVGKSRFKQISYYFIVIPHILICLKVFDPSPSLSLTKPLGWSKLKHPNLLFTLRLMTSSRLSFHLCTEDGGGRGNWIQGGNRRGGEYTGNLQINI